MKHSVFKLLLVIYTITLICTLSIRVKQEVKTIEAAVPSMKRDIDPAIIPNPDQLALEFMSYYFDAEDFNCTMATETMDKMNDGVKEFNASVKKEATTAEELAKNFKSLQKVLLDMRNSITDISNSECASIMKGLALHFRRQIFLISMK